MTPPASNRMVEVVLGRELRVGDTVNGRAVLELRAAPRPHQELGTWREAILTANTPSGRVTMSVFDNHCLTRDSAP